jgi:hypothetical protein
MKMRAELMPVVGCALSMMTAACAGAVEEGGASPKTVSGNPSAPATTVPSLETFDETALVRELNARAAQIPKSADKSLRAVDLLPPPSDLLAADEPSSVSPALAGYSSNGILDVLLRREKAVYGTDDRQEVFTITDPERRRQAESVAALVLRGSIQEETIAKKQWFRLRGHSFNELIRQSRNGLPLCRDKERFWNQPVVAYCSGALVAKNVILTARHCFDEQKFTADNVRFVFGFRMVEGGGVRTAIPAHDVYKAKEVIARGASGDGEGADWVLVRVEAMAPVEPPAKERSALPVRVYDPSAPIADQKIGDKADLYIIGHPVGLPQKYAAGANVKTNGQKAVFTATLDAYGGNSGSPVFDVSNQIVGLLVRGAPDFVKNPDGRCIASQIYPTTGKDGEVCVRAAEFASKIAAL